MTRLLRSVLLAAAMGLGAAALSCGGGGSADNDCTDGIDNDGDGLFDDQDPGCIAFGDTELDKLDCVDGIDNDGDGLVDAQDWGCQVSGSVTEVEPEGECNDGLDNDGDLLADFPQDPGCESPIDTTETNPPQCVDGIDNDGDGKADYPRDPGCESESDTDETTPDPAPACGDGVDSDGDGVTDYPDDPGCSSAADNSELDDCTTGLPVTGIFSGSLTGTTADGTGRLAAPSGCELDGLSSIASEVVFGFINTYSLSKLIVHTEGSALDTVLYLRPDSCTTPAGGALCDDNTVGTTSRVEVLNPPTGRVYYIVVDGKSNLGGNFKITVQGEIAPGGACDPSDTNFVCATGACTSGTCQ